MSWLLVTANWRDAVEPFGAYAAATLSLAFATINHALVLTSLRGLEDLVDGCVLDEHHQIHCCCMGYSCLRRLFIPGRGRVSGPNLRPAWLT
jgi:hypothetical protein